MATVTPQNIQVIKRRSLAFDDHAFIADSPIIFPSVEVFNPPRPIPDAKGSKSNDELAKIAGKKQPPKTWFDGDEEQLF